MKELLILALMLIAATASGYLIEGYVFWGIMGTEIIDTGVVYLYSDTTSSPIDYCCISPNGYYRFEDVASGRYWVRAFGKDPTGETSGAWKKSIFVPVLVSGANVYQDLYVNSNSTPPRECNPDI